MEKTIEKQTGMVDKSTKYVYSMPCQRKTADGEKYLLRGTVQGAADSGTAARAVEANGLPRVRPKGIE